MLSESPVFASFSTNDLAATKAFYHEKLGLKIRHEEEGGFGFEAGNGTHFMVYFKDNHAPASYTVLNFEVADLEAEVKALNDKGITCQQYDFMHTNELGISDMGDVRMAWITDPAGNIIGLMQEQK